jgi:hypothetical protein
MLSQYVVNLHITKNILFGKYHSAEHVTLNRFSSCKRHVSSSTCFSSLSLASLSAPVSLAACEKLEMYVNNPI